jgi:hypothetical protein
MSDNRIEVVENVVYEVQQRTRPSAPAEMQRLSKGLGDPDGWVHTKSWHAGQENDAHYWKERWEQLWGNVLEFRFNPSRATPERPATVTPAPFDLAAAFQEQMDEAKKVKA